MTPIFQILANSQDITDLISDRLIDLSITDKDGLESDTLSLTLDDRDYRLELPQAGARLEVSLGYRYGTTNRLAGMGTYTVDEVSLSGWPSQMTISAKAADMLATLKSSQTRSWHDTTLGAIAGQIAAENGLILRIDPSLASVHYAHIDQTNENAMSLLTRLAQEQDAVFKPANGCLILKPTANGKSATGLGLAVVPVSAQRMGSYDVKFTERGKYKSVSATWHSHNRGRKQTATVGSGKPNFTLTRSFPSETQARAAAQAAFDQLNRGTATLSTSVPGDPSLCANMTISVSGLRAGLNRDWIITTATHSLGGGGYMTSLECTIPQLAGETTEADKS
jgi:phage protein D